MIWTRARREKCRISGNRWLRGQRWPEANRWKRRKRRLCQPTSPCPPIGQAAFSCQAGRRSGPARKLIMVTALLSWSWISWGRRQRPLLSGCNQVDVCESVIALSNLAQLSRPWEFCSLFSQTISLRLYVLEKGLSKSSGRCSVCADVESGETSISRTRSYRS